MADQKNCDNCGEQIVFLRSSNARKNRVTIDATSFEKGDEIYDPERHTMHFKTCKAMNRIERRAIDYRREDWRGSSITGLVTAFFVLAMMTPPARAFTTDVKTQVLTVNLNILDEPPPYETIWGLVRIQTFKKPGEKKTRYYHYQLFGEGNKPGPIIVLRDKLPGITDRTDFRESHPKIYRFGCYGETIGKTTQAGTAAGAFVAGSTAN